MTPAASNVNSALDDPCIFSPHERLCELTAILANGIHRLRATTPAPPDGHPIPGESFQNSLEAVAETCPDGTECQPKRTPEA